MASSFEGARRAALLYSLVQNWKLIADFPPFDYLKDVPMRVATHPQRLIAQLTPEGWAETFRRQAAGVAASPMVVVATVTGAGETELEEPARKASARGAD